ncbi:MAG: Gfo/Idh/MocA family oxidoreductase [Gemmatimonadales bacterium]|nr:Gfo/Idh/MocA family oxidoreductase [Gemmatimonadales bacterium]
MSDLSSRREFLRTTAALAASSPLAAGFAAEVQAERAALPPRHILRPDEPVVVGVIGSGGMGTAHAEGFANAARDGRANVRVAALADVCGPRLDAAKKKVEAVQGADSCTTYGDYRALLARPDVHGVLVASPEHWHADMALDAIEAGKDVYIEKPMTRWLKDAFRLLDAAAAHPERVVNVGTQFVVTPSTVEAKRLIASGAIGKAVWSQTSYCRNSKEGEWLYYAIDPSWEPGVNLDWNAWCGPMPKEPWNPEVFARWRRYRKWSTGIIGDLLVHRMTPLVHAVDAGWPVRVTASGGHYVDKVMENHDQVNITVEFEGEHTMVIAGSTANQEGVPTVIRGHKANLFLEGRRTRLQPEQLFVNEVEEKTVDGEDHGDDQDEMRRQWLDCIRTHRPAPSPPDLATKVMVIVELATRSMWEKAAFGFNPATRKVRKL